MKTISLISKLFSIIVVTLLIVQTSDAQCETWHNLSNKDHVEDAYVLYRDYCKAGDYEKAYSYWEIVYKNAPTADGKRSCVYSDGRFMLTGKFNAAKKKKKQKEIANFIFRLMAEQKQCFPDIEITQPSKNIMKFRTEID